MKLLMFAVLLAVVAICQAKPCCDDPLQELINNYTIADLNKDKSGSSFLQVFAPTIQIGGTIDHNPKKVKTCEFDYETSNNHKIEWMPANKTTAAKYAQRALVAGYGTRGPLWAVRAVLNSNFLIPGKFAIGAYGAFIPFNGKEVEVQDFEILLAHPSTFQWIYSKDGQIPNTAFPVGHSSAGEPVYICRAGFKVHIPNGKLLPSSQHCSIGYNYVEHPVKEYEVLCRI